MQMQAGNSHVWPYRAIRSRAGRCDNYAPLLLSGAGLRSLQYPVGALLRVVFISLICFLLCGCTVIRYSDGRVQFSRSSFGTKMTVRQLIVITDTNGIRTITMLGYSNNQIDGIEAAARGAAQGAAK